jgi:hypothetical protein
MRMKSWGQAEEQGVEGFNLLRSGSILKKLFRNCRESCTEAQIRNKMKEKVRKNRD